MPSIVPKTTTATFGNSLYHDPPTSISMPMYSTKHQKPMNSSQPTFKGVDEDNIDIWLITTEINLQLADIPLHKWMLTAISEDSFSAISYLFQFFRYICSTMN
jgi:hypothetical protein